MYIGMDINPLDGATALARVEDGTIDKFCSGISQVGIRPHICCVIPTELKVKGNGPVCSSLSDRQPSGGGPGEAHALDLRRLDQALHHLRTPGLDDLEDIAGEPRLIKGFQDPLSDEGRLRRWL